jgi:hypothetical protein
LYLNKHHKVLKEEITAAQQAIFSQGTKVGELATLLFPGGVDCTPESFYDFQKAVIRKQEEIKQAQKLFMKPLFSLTEYLLH